MSTAAISKFLTDLAVHFPPKHARPELETAWLRSMSETLRGTPADVLDAAARKIIATRKYTTFPLPAECRQACMQAAEEMAARRRLETLPAMRGPNPNYYSEERDQLADDLMKCELGRQACHEGWQLAMWNFCRDNMRHPHAHEIERCKRDARGFDQTYEEVRRASENVGHMRNPILDFARNMLAEREKIKAEVLGP